MANVLYLSLTGMTEPLGRSQVLEYLIDLSKKHKICLISFEREYDLDSVDEIKELIKDYDIEWHYMVYSKKYGVVSTIGQIVQAIRLGSKLIKENSIDIIHARSMIPATMGLALKKMYGVKLLFDIRGFAIDEKVDSGRLKAHGFLYKTLKCLDNYLYRASDHIVTLTHKAKDILINEQNIFENDITVIPTCASKEVFKSISEKEKMEFKTFLGYHEKDKVIIHTGTVSGWYDFEKEVKLVQEMMKQDETLHFLVLNKNEQSYVQHIFDNYLLPSAKVKILSSSFDDMYKYLNIADVSLFFIKPSYSKQASAPTKFAENVACYLPSMTNANVGDMGYYLTQYDVGVLLDIENFDENVMAIAHRVLAGIDKVYNNEVFDTLFYEHFDKDMAVMKYDEIYLSLRR